MCACKCVRIVIILHLTVPWLPGASALLAQARTAFSRGKCLLLTRALRKTTEDLGNLANL